MDFFVCLQIKTFPQIQKSRKKKTVRREKVVHFGIENCPNAQKKFIDFPRKKLLRLTFFGKGLLASASMFWTRSKDLGFPNIYRCLKLQLLEVLPILDSDSLQSMNIRERKMESVSVSWFFSLFSIFLVDFLENISIFFRFFFVL